MTESNSRNPLAPSRSQLNREEYIEQAYMFRGLANRMESSEPIQDLLRYLKEEVLATTNLPHAIDFLLAELNHVGTMASAMKKLTHYFAPFQTYLIAEAEDERGRFDMNHALRILEQEAKMRADGVPVVAMFFFQFETICRNRLSYDLGLVAMSADPIYDEPWTRWLLDVRHQIGIVDISDLVYVHSEYYLKRQQTLGEANDPSAASGPTLFGEKEGRVALANRKKEPLYFFAALQRQLAYTAAPKPPRKDPNEDLLPKLQRTMERFDIRLKLLEDEHRDKGIDLSQFYGKPSE